jgi:hypothetical protein
VRNLKIFIAKIEKKQKPLKNASKFIKKNEKKFNFQIKKYFLALKKSPIID